MSLSEKLIKIHQGLDAHRDDEVVKSYIEYLLNWIGEDPHREGLRDTPTRVVKAFKEYFGGYGLSPSDILDKTFEDVSGYSSPILVRNIDFVSHCEHHLAPIVGVVHVSYIPNGRVVGLSKIPRIVDMFAHRLQLQERMTTDIAQTLQDNLNPEGVAVMIEATHFCLKARGVKKSQSDIQTMHYTGIYTQDHDLQKDFIQSCLKS